MRAGTRSATVRTSRPVANRLDRSARAWPARVLRDERRSFYRAKAARFRSALASLGLDDAAPHGVDGRLDPVLDLELHQDVRDVVLHRLRADVELGGDHRVVLAVRDQLQDLDLAVGEL